MSTFSGISCGSSLAMAHPKSNAPASLGKPLVDSCTASYGAARSLQQSHDWAGSYKSLKAFVEKCPTNYWAPTAFGDMSGDVQYGGDGASPECWNDFRSWLLSALAWNPNSVQYFCADVETLAGSLTGVYGPGADTSYAQVNRATNAGLAVINWIIKNPMCNNEDMRDLYTNSRGSQKETWFNTQDTTLVPFDTTLPSLHDLGLDSVLIYASRLGVHLPHSTPDILASITATPNPVGDNRTTISFTTGREAYVSLEVFDLLGHKMESADPGRVLIAGPHDIPISTSGWPSGTYYVRLTTTYGETGTVKLVKE